MPPTRKKTKKRSKKYSRRGDTVSKGSSLNKINIRIVSPQTPTPAIHPETSALNEQTRLHLNAVQQIISDHNKPPPPSMPPQPVRVPVKTSLESGRVRQDTRNPFVNQISPSPSRIGLHELLRTPDAEHQQSPINIVERMRRNSVAPIEPLESPKPTFPTHTPRGTRRLFYNPTSHRRGGIIIEGTQAFRNHSVIAPLVAVSPERSRLATYGL